MAEQIIFYILAIISIVFSIAAVTTKHIIRSVTFLLFVLFATAGMYLLLQFYYLFAVQVVVYAGGIMVLFIFAILLTNKPGEAMQKTNVWKRIGAGLLAVSGIIISTLVINTNINKIYNYVNMDKLHVSQLGLTLLGTNKYEYLIPFEAVSVLLLASMIGGIMIARKR